MIRGTVSKKAEGEWVVRWRTPEAWEVKLKSGRVLTLEDIERLAAEAEAGYDMENAVPVSVMVPLGRSEPELDNTCSACGKRLVDCECDFKAGHLTKSEP